MKHRNLFGALWLLSCSFLLALSLSSCATSAVEGVAIASGEQAAGDAYANAKLGKIDGTIAGTKAQQTAVADLTRVGNDLKAFAAGTLSFGELGAVEAQLKADGVALSSNTAAVNQINSILNIFAKNASSSGLVTPQQALAEGVVANIVSGFSISIQTYEGQWSVTNPTVWKVPAPTTRWSYTTEDTNLVAFKFER